MVKKKVGGAHRYKSLKAAGASSSAEVAEAATGPKPPQHLQKKITRKVKFIDKVAQSSTAAALQANKGLKKKKRKRKSALPDLQSLAGELEQLAGLQDSEGQQQAQQKRQQQRSGKGTKSSIKRSKARLAVGISEMQRLQQVVQHPMYKADPIQAITNHLTATMPAAPQPPQQRQQQGPKKMRKGKGAGAGVAEMQS
ncbi:hypothetical protein COO60DRAFT_1640105 [Scenedesmus sp. NREL 46B-D3]|nr:hypothetical protein COO60DRAFT_1640105 [Scenedesmus sp. NREL 46B-D3]